jgi:DNA polymerase-3 subunit alpha
LSHHPLDPYRELLACLLTVSSDAIAGVADGRVVQAAGLVTRVRSGTTRRGKPMASLTLEDFTGTLDAFVFSEALESSREQLVVDAPLMLTGRVSAREGRTPVIFADRVIHLETVACGEGMSLHLAVCGDLADRQIAELRDLLERFGDGGCPVHVYVDPGTPSGARVALRDTFVSPTGDLIRALGELLGPKAVRLVYGKADGIRPRELFECGALEAPCGDRPSEERLASGRL